MATGSGKTKVAFQTVWKLYNARNIRKVLFITDRNFSYKMLLTSLNLFFEKKEAADVIENQKTPKNRDIFCNISVSHFMKLSQQIGLT
jgi:type I restriction enzyme R subunit